MLREMNTLCDQYDPHWQKCSNYFVHSCNVMESRLIVQNMCQLENSTAVRHVCNRYASRSYRKEPV